MENAWDNCFNRLFAVWTVHAFIVDTDGRLTYILQSHTKYDDEGAVWPAITNVNYDRGFESWPGYG